MVISPSFFEAVRQSFYRLDTLCIPNEKTHGCRCHTTYPPNQLSHDVPLLRVGYNELETIPLSILKSEHVGAKLKRNSTLDALWTGFVSVARWDTVLAMRRNRC
jgi:hypothetical protein